MTHLEKASELKGYALNSTVILTVFLPKKGTLNFAIRRA
jgi:hypothetical protein